MVQFLLTLLMKQIILAVYHDFHWLAFKKSASDHFGSEESELETNILPPTPQPYQGKKKLIHNLFGESKAFEAKLKFWQEAVTLICIWSIWVFAKCTWRWWKRHTDAEYADKIVKLQREFDRWFQDFRNLEIWKHKNVFNTLWNWCWISAKRFPNGTVHLNRGGAPPRGNQ